MKKDIHIRELEIFRRHNGILKTMEALRLGIHPRNLYKMVEEGLLEKMSRGLYRAAKLPELSNPDIVTVAARAPKSVVCLISALSFHGITTQIPKEVYIAIAYGKKPPKIEYPPVRVFKFSKSSFFGGIETHIIDGMQVKIYDPEKTLADCFKFRKSIGLDTVLEALKLYLRRKDKDINKLIIYARICRVENVMRPYLESLL